MSNLSFFLSLQIFAPKNPFECLLTHENKLVIGDGARFVCILREQLCLVIRTLIMKLSVIFSIVIRQVSNVNGVQNVLLGKLMVHSNLIIFITHIIELFISEQALTATSY